MTEAHKPSVDEISASDYVKMKIEHYRESIYQRRGFIATIIQATVALLGVIIGWVAAQENPDSRTIGILVPVTISVVVVCAALSVIFQGMHYSTEEERYTEILSKIYERHEKMLDESLRPTVHVPWIKHSRFFFYWLAIVGLGMVGLIACYLRETSALPLISACGVVILALPLLVAGCTPWLTPFVVNQDKVARPGSASPPSGG